MSDLTYTNLTNEVKIRKFDCILMGLAKMFETLLPEIPGGVLFFLPSYSVMAELTSFWKRNGFWKTINKIKHIFVEDRNNAELIYSKYIDFVERGDGGLLIGVCRGSMSEGMDFSDTQARAVFLFGIPYPSYMDLEVRMKRTYNDKMCVTANSTNSNTTNINNNNTRNDVNNAISGSEWYETQAFRGVFQAIGRCIRHQNDYGSIVIVDQRFPNFVSKFPRWVSQSFVNHIGISDIKARMHDFYKDMEIKFPKKVLFTRGQRVIFVCDNCGELVVDIPKIDVDEAEQTRKAGFLKFVEAGNSINCLFLSRNTKKKLYVQESVDYLWSEEDLIAYNMVKCKCGSKLGMFIAATTREDSNYINGYMFLLNRLKIANNADSSQQKNSSQKSPSRSRSQRKKDSQNDSGQMKLSFL
ncbi:hypothetical protein TRFO_17578 [Tritrichomonas foetus]|uniref:ATP-dependent helicase C-terminal domain-containing protein n=1 Tax=Tritrichomonas foetus TaxID=1144522 RepID=A0A1J4KRT8_9EUKA|nr:hypothetical protein TRFO_17578 [Tritrichomonas foetus]|eukprot:OHT12532.1 hypothetical protein TRFO_17578 [Tritrichomonas foetus]